MRGHDARLLWTPTASLDVNRILSSVDLDLETTRAAAQRIIPALLRA